MCNSAEMFLGSGGGGIFVGGMVIYVGSLIGIIFRLNEGPEDRTLVGTDTYVLFLVQETFM